MVKNPPHSRIMQGDTVIAAPVQPKGRIKIGELAAHLGLAKSTVSRAMNGYEDIAEATRIRVETAARKLGYSPLSHAQAIRTGRIRAIGMVLEHSDPDGNAPFLQDFLAGACEVASGLSWTVTISSANSQTDALQAMRRLIEERKADGFILPRTAVDDARIALLKSLDVPFILYGRSGYGQGEQAQDSSYFDIAGETAMREAVLRLANYGHERIAYVGDDPALNYSQLRQEGYVAGLKAAGLELCAELLQDGARNRVQGGAAGRMLMGLNEPPTAIIFATDMAALGFYKVAAELNLTIGKDVSIIGYDGIPESQYIHPQLTTFNVDSRMAGRRLADMLIRQIRGEPIEGLREIGQAELIDGGSDGPPALTSARLSERNNQSRHNSGEENR